MPSAVRIEDHHIKFYLLRTGRLQVQHPKPGHEPSVPLLVRSAEPLQRTEEFLSPRTPVRGLARNNNVY